MTDEKSLANKNETAIAPLPAFSSKFKSVMKMHRQMEEEIELRKLLTEYIKFHMKAGVDFGKIHVAKNCVDKYRGCKLAGHMSKDSLFKPGAEKVASLLHLRPDCVKDPETWEMLGNKVGTVCYKCLLYNKESGKLEGMGIGVCTIEEKSSINTAIKIAKKRSFIDAILTAGSLSDFFTQDLEDMQAEDPQPRQAARSAPAVTRSPYNNAITYDDRLSITKQCRRLGYSKEALNRYVRRAYGQKTYEMLNHQQAVAIVGHLGNLTEKPVKKEQTASVTLSDTIKKGGGEKKEEPAKPLHHQNTVEKPVTASPQQTSNAVSSMPEQTSNPEEADRESEQIAEDVYAAIG